jgi:hypothetical protein
VPGRGRRILGHRHLGDRRRRGAPRLEVTFTIFAAGVELELFFVRRKDLQSLRAGPHIVLPDKNGILEGMVFSLPHVDEEAQKRELHDLVFWFWHDVGHFTTAIGRAAVVGGRAARDPPPLLREAHPHRAGSRGRGRALLEARRRDLDGAVGTSDVHVRSHRPRGDASGGWRSRRLLQLPRPTVARTQGLPYPTELDELMSHPEALRR